MSFYISSGTCLYDFNWCLATIVFPQDTPLSKSGILNTAFFMITTPRTRSRAFKKELYYHWVNKFKSLCGTFTSQENATDDEGLKGMLFSPHEANHYSCKSLECIQSVYISRNILCSFTVLEYCILFLGLKEWAIMLFTFDVLHI